MTVGNTSKRSTIALLHWGDLIEDFLDTINVSFEAFCNEMTGGWMFGYIEALKLAGIQTVLFCISARQTKSLHLIHRPTGAKICVLPAPEIYQAARRYIPNPYGWTFKETFGDVQGARRIPLRLLKDIAPYLATPLRQLARELHRQDCQAILSQDYEHARFDICVLLGKLISRPVFATFQGGDFQLSRFERLLRPLSLQACAGLIVGTQTEIHRLQNHYRLPPTKLARIFNPMDVANWQPMDRRKARAEIDLPLNAQIVIYHGRIELHRKGLDILIEAWEQLCNERPGQDLHLLLVGTGRDANKLRDRINTMQLPGIRWIDEYIRDRTAIQRYLSAADVYVLPSRHEGFPVAPLEAMACGLPIVAAQAPGVPDILEGDKTSGGLVVPCENAAALALALGQVLDDQDLRHRLGKAARARVEACFSLEVVGKQLRQVLLS